MRQQLSVSDQRHNQDPATPQTSAIGIPTQPLKTPVGDTLPTSFSNAASGTFAKQAIKESIKRSITQSINAATKTANQRAKRLLDFRADY